MSDTNPQDGPGQDIEPEPYAVGSQEPDAADKLLERDGRA